MIAQQQSLSPRQIAARKAWDTIRARKAVATIAVVAAAEPAPIVARHPAQAPTICIPAEHKPCDTSWRNRPCYVQPVLQPVEDLRAVDIWLDHWAVGCGERRYIVLEESEAEVKLFYVPQLIAIVIPRKTFDDRQRPARKFSRHATTALVRRRLAMTDQVNNRAQAEVLSDGGADTVAALALLEKPQRRH